MKTMIRCRKEKACWRGEGSPEKGKKREEERQ